MGKSIQFIIGGRLLKEEENHNKSTQGCMRLNRPGCLKGDSEKGDDFRRGDMINTFEAVQENKCVRCVICQFFPHFGSDFQKEVHAKHPHSRTLEFT